MPVPPASKAFAEGHGGASDGGRVALQRGRKGLDGTTVVGQGGATAAGPWVRAHQMETSMAAAGGQGRWAEGEQARGPQRAGRLGMSC